MTSKSAERIPALERREQILAAATAVFGERGYAGATTDQVAREAGISQPYVVRMFGSKQALFLEVAQRALDRILAAFRGAIADTDSYVPLTGRLGTAYVDLISDRGLLMSLLQSFMLGHDPVIGPAARAGFIQVYTLLRDEGGLSPDAARSFLAEGMLINTMLASGMADDYGTSTEVDELLACTFQGKIGLVVDDARLAAAEAAG
jgi:AcrR family transcriptional regulator